MELLILLLVILGSEAQSSSNKLIQVQNGTTDKCEMYSSLGFTHNWCMNSLQQWNRAVDANSSQYQQMPTYDDIVTDSMSDSEAKTALINAAVASIGRSVCGMQVYKDSLNGTAPPYTSYTECVRDILIDVNGCDESKPGTKLILENLIGKAEVMCNSDGTHKTNILTEVVSAIYIFIYTNGNVTVAREKKGIEVPNCIGDKIHSVSDKFTECMYDIYYTFDFNGQPETSASEIIPKMNRNLGTMANCLGNSVLPNSESTTDLTTQDLVKCKSFGVGLKKYILIAFPVEYGYVSLAELSDTEYKPRAVERRTLMCFGDPHCRFYDPEKEATEWVTCAAPGNHIWLKNTLFTLNMTTTSISSTSSPAPTIVTAFHLTFRSSLGAYMGSYSASGGILPPAFDGSGSDTLTAQGETGEEEVITVGDSQSKSNPNVKYVKLQGVQHGFFASFIKRSDSYPVVVLRISKPLLDKSSGMFITGCPEDQIIRRSSRRKRQTDCIEACSDQGDRASSCELDCDNLGTEYAQAASSSVVIVEDEAKTEDSTLVDPVEWANQNSGTQTIVVCVTLIALLMLVHLR